MVKLKWSPRVGVNPIWLVSLWEEEIRHTKSHQEYIYTGDKPQWDIERRWPFVSQGERPQEKLTLKKKRKKKKPTQPAPQSWTSNLQYYKKTNFCCLSHPTCVFYDDSSCKLVRVPHFHFVLVPANDVAGFDFLKDNLILLLGDSNPHERWFWEM